MSETLQLEPELEQIAAKLDGLTLLQTSKLVKALESRWGVSAAAPVAAAAPAASAAAAPKAEDKTSFDVVLESGGANKIGVIKEVRAITALGLKEAKDLVEGAPKPLKQGVTKDEADKIKAQIEGAGGKVKIS
jgi:large subunit ribosomal protein L7/L12